MKIGRNDPCPCGSGNGNIARLTRFVENTYGPDGIERAWEDFIRDTVFAGAEFEVMDEMHVQVFGPWHFHQWVPSAESLPAVPPTRLYLDRKASRLDPLLRSYLEACVSAPFGFHEILRNDPNPGFRVRDVFTDDECEVLERSDETPGNGASTFRALARD